MKRFKITTILFLGLLSLSLQSIAQSAASRANYDESKVPEFEIPDLLTSFEGEAIHTALEWETMRRPELLDFFTNQMYGKVPGDLAITKWEVIEEGTGAINGKAKRKQVDIHVENNGKKLSFNILLYLPNNVEKAPMFLGYNFYGNHIVYNDPNIRISNAWARNNNTYGITEHRLTEESRGAQTENWQVEKIIDAGYGLATIYYGEVDPDRDDFSDGIHPLFYNEGQDKPLDNEWGAISAWAWGLTKAMDYLEQDPGVDASKVITFGHSRLGKTSLWAGVVDERFAGAISNNSGCGGAALSKRKFGETLEIINNAFPHWFCDNFNIYNDNEEALPVDQHALIALMAPRPVYIASAEEDQWADPKGEFLSGFYATPVYKLFGKSGIDDEQMPGIHHPIHNSVAYHIRSGKHAVTAYDWEQYIKWADIHVKNQ